MVVVQFAGGGGGGHLATVPQGVVEDCLPWGGAQQGEGGIVIKCNNAPGKRCARPLNISQSMCTLV